MNERDNPDHMTFERDPKTGEARVTDPRAVMRWADSAMYRSTPLPEENRAEGGGARPSVVLLNATPDPLGSLGALVGIYEGRVTRSLGEVTDEQRRSALRAMQQTKLDGPLEAIQFHFLIEGVTRAFTHQAVRSRFSFFAQESLRFAVVEGQPWLNRQAYPPSLAAKPVPSKVATTGDRDFGADWDDNPDYGPEEHAYAMQRDAWDDAIMMAQNSYQALIDAGVPAEDARGLMPHSMTTRYHWIVSLRTLLGEAGKRLCTQAQFEWRLVMAEIVKAIRAYADHLAREVGQKYPSKDVSFSQYRWASGHPDHWQFNAMADLLRPVCYQEGRCGFMAQFDRGCKIRERVEQNAAIGRPSSLWHEEHLDWSAMAPAGSQPDIRILPIYPREWLADPSAARVNP